ncbi:hypothetical protein GCM10017673_44570 [Streptosporangium violaceochromogenes]|nr:hypothetical protein GCM10017673_44570 [Streptosporangium violaceochromogenes]
MSQYDEFRRAGVFDILAGVFDTEAKSRALLEETDADPTRLPPFGGVPPVAYWRQVGRELSYGMGPSLSDLMAAAARLYPGNSAFARYATPSPAPGPPAGSAPAAPPAPPRGLPVPLPGVPRDPPTEIGGRTSLRVLCLQASPDGTAALRLDREYRELLAIAGARSPRKIDFTLSPATRADDIQGHLLSSAWDIVHFSGHGSAGGLLAFEDTLGRACPVSVAALAGLFAAASASLECVVLTSCYSGAYASALRPVAKTVVGSAEPIDDRCATAFLKGFYTALAAGGNIHRAFANGVSRMGFDDCPADRMHIDPQVADDR